MKFVLYILLLISAYACIPRCYVTDYNDVLYKDVFNNEFRIRSRGMFAKEIDTIFIKENITGITLNSEQPNDSLRFTYDIYMVEKLEKNIFLFQIITDKTNIYKKDSNKQHDCNYYPMLTEKINGKIYLKKIAKGYKCNYLYNESDKRQMAKKILLNK